jgi:hypothetical protein
VGVGVSGASMYVVDEFPSKVRMVRAWKSGEAYSIGVVGWRLGSNCET